MGWWGHARWIGAAFGFALANVGCGGSEFVTAPGSDDSGLGAETSLIDGTSPADAERLPDGNAVDAGDATVMSGQDSSTTSPDSGDAATPPDDAASDAGDGGAATFSCAALIGSDVVFCSDFDEMSAPPWNWPSNPVFGAAKDAVDTTDFLSPPNGYAASSSASFTTMSASLAYLGEPFTSLDLHISYTFQLFVKSYDALTKPSVPIAQLSIGPQTTSELSLELVLQGGNLYLDQLFTGTDGGPQAPSIMIAPVATATWLRVELLLDRSAASWIATVFFDGVSKLVTQTSVTPSDQDLEVDLGILDLLPPPGTNAIVFDNVIVRAY
jgi:hypothetical protein